MLCRPGGGIGEGGPGAPCMVNLMAGDGSRAGPRAAQRRASMLKERGAGGIGEGRRPHLCSIRCLGDWGCLLGGTACCREKGGQGQGRGHSMHAGDCQIAARGGVDGIRLELRSDLLLLVRSLAWPRKSSGCPPSFCSAGRDGGGPDHAFPCASNKASLLQLMHPTL